MLLSSQKFSGLCSSLSMSKSSESTSTITDVAETWRDEIVDEADVQAFESALVAFTADAARATPGAVASAVSAGVSRVIGPSPPSQLGGTNPSTQSLSSSSSTSTSASTATSPSATSSSSHKSPVSSSAPRNNNASIEDAFGDDVVEDDETMTREWTEALAIVAAANERGTDIAAGGANAIRVENAMEVLTRHVRKALDKSRRTKGAGKSLDPAAASSRLAQVRDQDWRVW